MHRIRHEIEQAAVARLARDRGRQIGAAVIGVFAGDDVLLLRLADEVEIELDKTERRVDRSRAARGEEKVLEVARRILCQPGAEIDRGWRRDQTEGRVVA